MTQLSVDELDSLLPMRVAEVHRSRIRALGQTGSHVLAMPTGTTTGDVAVGDWVLTDPADERVVRILERRSEFSRKSAGLEQRVQLIAANIDTIFIVSSCNADFNPARLERFIAVSLESGAHPVVVLTKSDLTLDAHEYVAQARALSPLADVIALNAKDADDLTGLKRWCGPGQTVALVGSSGVGKSTITNGLAGTAIATAGIREDDAKGRHTTTSRSLYPISDGGWLIDTPGIREIGVQDAAEGIDTVFSDLVELARTCKFNDCAHETEPGCAVQAAVTSGDVDPERLDRWRKLQREDKINTESIAQRHTRVRTRESLYHSGRQRGKDKRGDM